MKHYLLALSVFLAMVVVVLSVFIGVQGMKSRAASTAPPPVLPSRYGDLQAIVDQIYVTSPPGSFSRTNTQYHGGDIETKDMRFAYELGRTADQDLYAMTTDQHPLVRQFALWALFLRNGESSSVVLTMLLDDTHQCVRSDAAMILLYLYPESDVLSYPHSLTSNTREEATRTKRQHFEWMIENRVLAWSQQVPTGHGDKLDFAQFNTLEEEMFLEYRNSLHGQQDEVPLGGR
ncbi:MAG: HEAT repeat domain-containing protein [Planctomycetota bacterium]